jgi:tyrosyl-tRNA synthetase
LYPLLQGYDSVAMDVDLELGGSDQTFNMLAGRTLMKAMKNKEKFVMTTPLLSDSKGVKIGKTEGNVIALTDEPSDLFGKIMSLGDDAIIPMFTLLTDVPLPEIKTFDLKKNAMALKKKVAGLLVTTLHGEQEAKEAEENFSKTFQKGEIPEDMEEVENSGTLMEILVKNKIVASNSEVRRLAEENAITDLGTDKKITDVNFSPESGTKYRIGKKRFVKVK